MEALMEVAVQEDAAAGDVEEGVRAKVKKLRLQLAGGRGDAALWTRVDEAAAGLETVLRYLRNELENNVALERSWRFAKELEAANATARPSLLSSGSPVLRPVAGTQSTSLAALEEACGASVKAYSALGDELVAKLHCLDVLRKDVEGAVIRLEALVEELEAAGDDSSTLRQLVYQKRELANGARRVAAALQQELEP